MKKELPASFEMGTRKTNTTECICNFEVIELIGTYPSPNDNKEPNISLYSYLNK